MKISPIAATGIIMALGVSTASADEVTILIHNIDAKGPTSLAGTLGFEDSEGGLRIKPNLKNLPAGPHGFHVHEKPDCGPGEKDGKVAAGLAAGGHYDPKSSGKHEGPLGKGHLGDLPILEVDTNGAATQSMVAPRLKVADLRGRAIIIHEGADNYADRPQALGGGGARIACGIVK